MTKAEEPQPEEPEEEGAVTVETLLRDQEIVMEARAQHARERRSSRLRERRRSCVLRLPCGNPTNCARSAVRAACRTTA